MTPQNLIRDVGFCLVFFTRLPMPDLPIGERKLSEAIWAAPVAGWAVALLGGMAFWVTNWLGLPSGPAAALALATTMLATGCLHEDGLSDTADGFGGGRTKERALEIMHDSRIGAFGACALAISILLRWTALADIAAPSTVFIALLAAHGASRALLPLFMLMLPPARPYGLSAGAGTVERNAAYVALALGAASLLVLGIGGAVATAILLVAAFLVLRALCLKKIGGQTGDTLGALQQTAEILVLLVVSSLF